MAGRVPADPPMDIAPARAAVVVAVEVAVRIESCRQPRSLVERRDGARQPLAFAWRWRGSDVSVDFDIESRKPKVTCDARYTLQAAESPAPVHPFCSSRPVAAMAWHSAFIPTSPPSGSPSASRPQPVNMRATQSKAGEKIEREVCIIFVLPVRATNLGHRKGNFNPVPMLNGHNHARWHVSYRPLLDPGRP